MKITSFLNPPPVFVEIGLDWLKARQADQSVEVPLERRPDGRLAESDKAKAIAALKDFLKPKSWQPRAQAWCAINARGISLRRLSLPGGKDFHERLLLQIESEFPLPPNELAWGCQSLSQTNGAISRQDLLVAAIKKELVADYHEILRACGTEPAFTLASLARWKACGQPANSFTMLDVGATQSELTFFENGVPTASRLVFWDDKSAGASSSVPLDALAQNIKGSLTGAKLFVSGHGVTKDFAERLERSLAHGWKCEPIEIATPDGGSAAISGLEKFAAHEGSPPLVLRLETTGGAAAKFTDLDLKIWGTRAGVLAAAALLLPFAEPLLLKPHLEKKVAAFKAEAGRLKVIDRERDFLDNLKLNQPPYVDVLYVFSKSVPPGTRFDSLSLNSHGEVSLRCGFRDGQQVADFRNKLIASGFFTNVVVEEQSPTPDRQKVNVRMSAQERPAGDLQAASIRLAADDSAKAAKKPSPENMPAAPSAAPASKKDSQ